MFELMGNIYTKEQQEFLKKNFPSYKNKKLTELFNKKFKTNKTEHNISYATKCFCGLRGRYSKERIKRMSESARGNHNRWKQPHPIGHERIDKDGYILVKVGYPRIEKRKQFVVWEQYNKPTDKKTEVLMFLDGDRKNCSIENLFLMKRRYIGTYNYLTRGKQITKELVPSYIRMSELYCETKQKKKKRKKEVNSTALQELNSRTDMIKIDRNAGLSNKDIAEKYGLSSGYVCHLINGKRKFTGRWKGKCK